MADFPALLPKETLLSLTVDRARAFFNGEYASAPAEHREWFLEQANSAAPGMAGDIRACCTVADMFCDPNYPSLLDPKMAYQWNGWAWAQTDESTWHAYFGVPGGDLAGVQASMQFSMAQYLVLFGSTEEKLFARDVMINYIETYRSDRKITMCVDQLIYTLLGIPTNPVFRNGQYDLSCVADRELAIQYYKWLIDTLVANGYTDSARSTAGKLEGLLGISYYTDSAPDDAAPGGSTTKGGCYVATCVYGSYDCPQVWTLRRYRDNCLANTRPGRAFIRAYYAISPHLVRTLGQFRPIRAMWKTLLDPLVRALNRRGYADAPYRD